MKHAWLWAVLMLAALPAAAQATITTSGTDCDPLTGDPPTPYTVTVDSDGDPVKEVFIPRPDPKKGTNGLAKGELNFSSLPPNWSWEARHSGFRVYADDTIGGTPQVDPSFQVTVTGGSSTCVEGQLLAADGSNVTVSDAQGENCIPSVLEISFGVPADSRTSNILLALGFLTGIGVLVSLRGRLTAP